MDTLIIELLDRIAQEGPMGMAIIICLFSMGFALSMGWFYHRYKTMNLQTQLEESKFDKRQLMALVKNNTLSIERNTSALHSNTETVKGCIKLIEHMIRKLQL